MLVYFLLLEKINTESNTNDMVFVKKQKLIEINIFQVQEVSLWYVCFELNGF